MLLCLFSPQITQTLSYGVLSIGDAEYLLTISEEVLITGTSDNIKIQ